MSGPEVIAGEAAKQIAKAIDSAMEGPSKEIGNYIGDKIRYLRYNSLIKIVKKAEEKAKEQGMSLKMPPLKFFVPFCEAASLEEADTDASLADLWANVLLNVQKYDDTRHLLYLRILKEITKEEADLLINIVEQTKAKVFSEGRSWTTCDKVEIFDEELIELFIDELPDNFNERQVITAIVNCLECPGVWIHYMTLFSKDPYDLTDYYSYYDYDRESAIEKSVQVLESLGLVKRFRFTAVRFKARNDVSLWADGIVITDLGYSFYKAVSQKDYEKPFSITANSPEEHKQVHETSR